LCSLFLIKNQIAVDIGLYIHLRTGDVTDNKACVGEPNGAGIGIVFQLQGNALTVAGGIEFAGVAQGEYDLGTQTDVDFLGGTVAC